MKADTITKDYLKDPHIFADIFNYYIYDGKPVITPDSLRERDTVKTALPYHKSREPQAVQKLRDVQKLYVSKTDGEAEYILLGIESQTDVHFAMPVRTCLYDVLDYTEQIEQTAKSHRRVEAAYKPDKGEFLSGFWKKDKIIPSITLTLYLGADAWNGPLSLLDMMDIKSPKTRAIVQDYHINLIAPAQMTDEDINKLETGIREVLLFIKYSKDDKKLMRALLADGSRFKNLERRAADVIRAVTKSEIQYGDKEETIDMCEAIRQLQIKSELIGEKRGLELGQKRGLELGEKRGLELGEKRGLELGEKRGLELGEKRGELNAKRSAASNFYALGIDMVKISQALGESLEVIKEWVKPDEE